MIADVGGRPADRGLARGPLRVALDAGPLLDPSTGVGRYTMELRRHLELLGAIVRPYAVSLRGRGDGSVARWRVPARAAQHAWRRFDRPSIARLVGPVDVVHGTNFVLPALGDAPGVVTVHDLSFQRDDTFPGGERLRDLVPWSLRRARRVVVPTNVIADEVVDHYRLRREDVAVTHEGVSEVFFGARPLGSTVLGGMGIPGPFAVAVGTIEPRKNLGRLLRAWRRAAVELEGWTLVLAGPAGWGPGLPSTPGVVPVGWVGDETLPGLLAAADVFCYPSQYEGFGLPPLEAMAAGTAVLVGRYSAADEVLGDAALLVEPTDVDAIAGGLIALATDEGLRRRFAMAGKARAARYTWEATARGTLRAYREACERS
ncbi:glycosyltransferase family 1 protein [soil metagenome]